MDRKYKLLLSSSLVAMMATGCSSQGFRGGSDPQTSITGSTGGYAGQQSSSSGVVAETTTHTTCGQCALDQIQSTNIQNTQVAGVNTQVAAVNNNGRTQQWYVDQWNRQQAGNQSTNTVTTNGRTQQWYIDQYNRNQAATKVATTTTNGRSQQWYIDQYNLNQAAKANTTTTVATATNGRTKQWYVDQWNRQQAATKKQPAYVPPKPVAAPAPVYVAPAYVPPKPVAPVKPYVAPVTTTQYIDYTNGAAATAPAPSNKSLYTGSYQQPVQAYTQYTPKTYTGGASASTSTTTTTYTAPASTVTSSANTYLVKKGDTVFEVMRQTGVYWKEIISLNKLQAPSYTIQPGQQLRLK